MACLTTLKCELRALESTFPVGHSVLEIRSASVDELTCRFREADTGRKHVIHANITVRKEFATVES